jgi:hypothetical protein
MLLRPPNVGMPLSQSKVRNPTSLPQGRRGFGAWSMGPGRRTRYVGLNHSHLADLLAELEGITLKLDHPPSKKEVSTQ